jgi:hypothetical protein
MILWITQAVSKQLWPAMRYCPTIYPDLDPRARTTHKGMVQFDMSKPALIFFLLQEYTQQNTLSKF